MNPSNPLEGFDLSSFMNAGKTRYKVSITQCVEGYYCIVSKVKGEKLETSEMLNDYIAKIGGMMQDLTSGSDPELSKLRKDNEKVKGVVSIKDSLEIVGHHIFTNLPEMVAFFSIIFDEEAKSDLKVVPSGSKRPSKKNK